MGKKMSNAPVYYTVAQVQFNPILNLDRYLPSIQAQMREMHFPDYKHEVFQKLILPFSGTDAGQVTPPSLAPQSRFLFGDIEGRSCFLLEQNAMSFQTTAYDTFETYSALLLKGLSILHAALRLDFIERIGLRYLDAVQPAAEDDSLKDYLIPEVLGLSQKLGGQFGHAMSETVSVTAAGQLVSRVIIRSGRVGLPSELSTSAPQIAPRFTQQECLHAIIDTDASIVQRDAFDLDKIKSRLSALHDEIRKSFDTTVTEHARAVWA